MGAISSPSCIPILEGHLADPERTVRETCEIAIAKIKWDNSEEGQRHLSSIAEPEATPSVLAILPSLVHIEKPPLLQRVHLD